MILSDLRGLLHLMENDNKLIIGFIILGAILFLGYLVVKENSAKDQTGPLLNITSENTRPKDITISEQVKGVSTSSTQETTSATERNQTPPASPTKPEIKQYNSPPEMNLDKTKKYWAVLHTSLGDIKVDLFTEKTPITVNNFVFLARDGFYNGTKFHRVISAFMIQGGDPLGNGTGGPGYKFADEPFEGDYKAGTVAMANSGPNTNGSQFFIIHKDTTNLPKQYVIFGKVSDDNSMETVAKIAYTPVETDQFGNLSKPKTDVIIESVYIANK